MTISDDNQAISVVISKEKLEIVDGLAREMGISRAQFIRWSVDNAISDWRFFTRLGLTPGRTNRVVSFLRKLGVDVDEDQRLVWKGSGWKETKRRKARKS